MKLHAAFFVCLLSAACTDFSKQNQGFGGSGGTSSNGSGSPAATGNGNTAAVGTTGSGTPAATGATSGTGNATSGQTGATGATSGATTSATTGTSGDPYNTPPTCSSMTMAVGGNNANMKPGAACQSCHVLGGAASGKTFDVSGTVYLTAHEPDDCNGVNVSNAVVIITDANGMDTSLPVNSVGNFYHEDLFGFAGFAKPIKARVSYNSNTRNMVSSATTGDCNSCHTETGAQNAPGRIMLP